METFDKIIKVCKTVLSRDKTLECVDDSCEFNGEYVERIYEDDDVVVFDCYDLNQYAVQFVIEDFKKSKKTLMKLFGKHRCYFDV